MFLFDAELGKSTKKAGKTKSGKTGKKSVDLASAKSRYSKY